MFAKGDQSKLDVNVIGRMTTFCVYRDKNFKRGVTSLANEITQF